jgi:hypothetical protein
MNQQLEREETTNGVRYAWGVDSPDGAWFELFPVRGTHTRADVQQAKHLLRNAGDVLRFYVSWEKPDAS